MNFRRIGLLPIAAGIGLLCASAVWAQGVQSQKATTGVAQKKDMLPILPKPVAPSVEILGLSATPAAPKEGEMVTFKLFVRNTGKGVVAQVPWAIRLNTANQTLAQGVFLNMKSMIDDLRYYPETDDGVGVAQWRAVPGEHLIQGYVDAANTIKNTAPIAARIKNLSLIVAKTPEIFATARFAALKMETQVLHAQKAKEAGAQIVNTLMPGALAVCMYFGIDVPPESGFVDNATNTSVNAGINCHGVGATVTGEAFKDFRLKNGWKIKAVTDRLSHDIDISQPVFPVLSWQYRLKPQVGSNDPNMIVEMTGGGGGAPATYSHRHRRSGGYLSVHR